MPMYNVSTYELFTLTYNVEANTKDEAINKVLAGRVVPSGMDQPEFVERAKRYGEVIDGIEYDGIASVEEDDESSQDDDVCDICLTTEVTVERTTWCGKTIGIECGCDAANPDGLCGDEECEDCGKDRS